MIGVWMTPCKNGQCELSVRRDGINKIVIASQTPLTDAQVEELFWLVGAMQNSGKTLKDLLKEQEPKPITYTDNPYTGLPVARCPKCGKFAHQFHSGITEEETHYCPWCGQAVKWE